MKASDALRLMGKPVAYYKNLSRHLGGATATILFSQLFYWSDKTDNPNGVYKQLDELCEETGLTLEELRTARKKLIGKGVLVETNKRLEHKIYFRIDFDAFDELMAEFGEQGKADFVIDQENTNTRLNTNTPLTPQGEDSPNGKSKNNHIAEKIDYQAIADAWNQVNENSGGQLPFVEKINNDRKRDIKKFLGELSKPTLECVRNYFEAFFAAAKPHHFGENDRGWRANFDFAIKPKQVLRVREGAL
ncbi:DNA replication protein [Aggregatibacter segnis]|uniref:DNA replication protein n=1 Tax=Aggregatibacter segnis TaxID=739 RepID=UPI003FA081E7